MVIAEMKSMMSYTRAPLVAAPRLVKSSSVVNATPSSEISTSSESPAPTAASVLKSNARIALV